MVMVKLVDTPLQVPMRGVTVIVAVSVVLPPLVAVKLRPLPVPFAVRPMLVLLLDHAKVAPVVPLKTTLTVLPAHVLILLTGLTTGGEWFRRLRCSHRSLSRGS